MDFKNKVVIVTGGSSGIGAATAKLFASHGALVSLVGRNIEQLHRVASECFEYHGNMPLQVPVDLTHTDSCETVVNRTVERYKRIDVLVNCAGRASLASLFDDNMEVFNEMIDLNLRVRYRLVNLCIPHLVKTKGNVVNVFGSSHSPRPGFLISDMIIHALEKFTSMGATEIAPEGVRMNSVRPGVTRTNFMLNFNVSSEHLNYAWDKVAEEVMPCKKPLEPEEVARMILVVASDKCPHLNGANIRLDGAAGITG